jgi:putative transposase
VDGTAVAGGNSVCEVPKYLIRDNDSKFGAAFSRVATISGIKQLRIAYKAPKMNSYCERFLGSVRRECLDHLLILGEQHLHERIKEYVAYFNSSRPVRCGFGIQRCSTHCSRRPA